MTDAWKVAAEEILGELQAKVTARDLAGLLEFFEDPAVLIGTAGDGRTSDSRREYLTAVTTQPAAVVGIGTRLRSSTNPRTPSGSPRSETSCSPTRPRNSAPR